MPKAPLSSVTTLLSDIVGLPVVFHTTPLSIKPAPPLSLTVQDAYTSIPAGVKLLVLTVGATTDMFPGGSKFNNKINVLNGSGSACAPLPSSIYTISSIFMLNCVPLQVMQSPSAVHESAIVLLKCHAFTSPSGPYNETSHALISPATSFITVILYPGDDMFFIRLALWLKAWYM